MGSVIAVRKEVELASLLFEIFVNIVLREKSMEISEASPSGMLKVVVVTLRVDADVMEWFRNKGKGCQAIMNAVLKGWVEQHRS